MVVRSGNVGAVATVAGLLGILAFIFYGYWQSLQLTSVQIEVLTDSQVAGNICNCTGECLKWVAEGQGGVSHFEENEKKAEYVSVCTTESSKDGGWFGHCDAPLEDGARERMDAYVRHRMARYTGTCSGEALQFHCLEFAARMGWCDWSKQPSPKPPTKFLNPDKCDAILKRPAVRSEGSDASGHADDHKIVFFYPSYSHVKMLKRTITALLHPNHVFLIQFDREPYHNATYVQDVVEWANTHDSICVTEYGRVLYTRSSQVLITFPAIAWAEQIEGWTHFFLMGAQSYPIVPLEDLRKFSWNQRDNIAFAWAPLKVDGERRLTESLPYCYGYTHLHHNWGEERVKLGTWIDDMGVQHPPPDNMHSGGRIDWMEKRLGKPWNMMKSGFEVSVIPKFFSKFLLHDPNGKMWIQYFTYTMISCENLLPTIANVYFKDRLFEISTCFMTWEKGWIENKKLNLSDWDAMAGMSLFARKFQLPASEEMLDRIDVELRTKLSLPRPWHNWSDVELRREALASGDGAGPAKIAFLFLIGGEGVHFTRIWNRFFEGHEGKYNIYVHIVPGVRLGSEAGVFAGRQVPSKGWTTSTWPQAAAIRRLIENALVDDGANQRFILISDGVIPLRSFSYLENLTIANNADKSFQEVIMGHWSAYRYNKALEPFLKKEQFAVGSIHFALTRQHARMIVNDTTIWHAFYQCGSDVGDPGGACHQEEHYFSTFLSLQDSDGLIKQPVVQHADKKWMERSNGDIAKALESFRNNGDHFVFVMGANATLEGEILGLGADVLQY